MGGELRAELQQVPDLRDDRGMGPRLAGIPKSSSRIGRAASSFVPTLLLGLVSWNRLCSSRLFRQARMYSGDRPQVGATTTALVESAKY